MVVSQQEQERLKAKLNKLKQTLFMATKREQNVKNANKQTLSFMHLKKKCEGLVWWKVRGLTVSHQVGNHLSELVCIWIWDSFTGQRGVPPRVGSEYWDLYKKGGGVVV